MNVRTKCVRSSLELVIAFVCPSSKRREGGRVALRWFPQLIVEVVPVLGRLPRVHGVVEYVRLVDDATIFVFVMRLARAEQELR